MATPLEAALAAVADRGSTVAPSLATVHALTLEVGVATVLRTPPLRAQLVAAVNAIVGHHLPAVDGGSCTTRAVLHALRDAVDFLTLLSVWPSVAAEPGTGDALDAIARASLDVATRALFKRRDLACEGADWSALHRSALNLLTATLDALTADTVRSLAVDAKVAADACRAAYLEKLLLVLSCRDDFATLNVAWKHVMRFVVEARALPSDVLDRLVVDSAAGIEEHLAAYVLIAHTDDAKAKHKELTLHRFYLAHLSQLLRAHGAAIAAHPTAAQHVVRCLVRARGRATPTALAPHAYPPEVLAALTKQVALPVDAVLCQWLGQAALDGATRSTLVGHVVAAGAAKEDADEALRLALGGLQLALMLLHNWGAPGGGAQPAAPTEAALPLTTADALLLLRAGVLDTVARLPLAVFLAPPLPTDPPTANDTLLWQTITTAATAAACLPAGAAVDWERTLLTALIAAATGPPTDAPTPAREVAPLPAVVVTAALTALWYQQLHRAATPGGAAAAAERRTVGAAMLLLDAWVDGAFDAGADLRSFAVLQVAHSLLRLVGRAAAQEAAEQALQRARAAMDVDTAAAAPGGARALAPTARGPAAVSLPTVRAVAAIHAVAGILPRLPPSVLRGAQQLVDRLMVQLLAAVSVVFPRQPAGSGGAGAGGAAAALPEPARVLQAIGQAAFLGRHLALALRDPATAALLLTATLPRLASVAAAAAAAVAALLGSDADTLATAGLDDAQGWGAGAPLLALATAVLPVLPVADSVPLLQAAADAVNRRPRGGGAAACAALLLAGWVGACGHVRPRTATDATAFGPAVAALSVALLSLPEPDAPLLAALAKSNALHELMQFGRYTTVPHFLESMMPPDSRPAVVRYITGEGTRADAAAVLAELDVWRQWPAAASWRATPLPRVPARAGGDTPVHTESVDTAPAAAPPSPKRPRLPSGTENGTDPPVVAQVRTALERALADVSWLAGLDPAAKQALHTGVQQLAAHLQAHM